MTRLSIGDRVVDINGAREGRIIDIDGETAYVMQPNGVEIEFPLGKLKPYEEPNVKTSQGSPQLSRGQTLNLVQRRLLASVPNEIRDAVAQSYDKGGESGARQTFAELTDERKLETIRIYLPSLPRHLLSPHLKLVVAFRDIARDVRPSVETRKARNA
jgi:hypothetical protein